MKKPKIPPHVIEDIKGPMANGVGYRSPPPQHRFRKGQSGNPKGRPRSKGPLTYLASYELSSNAAIMEKVLNEPVTSTKNGQRVRISKAEANQRNIEKQAFNGSVNASRDLTKQLLAADYQRQEKKEHIQSYWHQYLLDRSNAIEYANRSGLSLNTFWIEPQDIEFNDTEIVSVRGPMSAQEKPHYEFLERLLRMLIFEVNYDACYFADGNDVARAEIKLLVRLQKTVTSVAERASNAYWDELENDYLCLNWKMAQNERKKVWNAIGFPVPSKRWLNPMPTKDIKFCRQNCNPIQKLIADLTLRRHRRKPRSQKRID